MGSLVRESVAAYLAALPAEDDSAFGIIGMLGEDEGPLAHGDVAANHDAYLADAYAAEAGTQESPEDTLGRANG